MSGRKKKKRRSKFVIRITGAGWMFFVVSLVVGISSAKTGMPMMFVIFGALFGAILFSSPVARGNLAGLGVKRELPERVWQYETLYFGYYLRNHRRLFSSLGIELQEIGRGRVIDAGGYCVHLPRRSSFRAGSRLFAEERGEINLDGIRLYTRFPMGLVEAFREVYSPVSLIVWPARGRLKVDILQHGAMHSSSVQPGRRPGGQDEFFGLKEYRQGDNPRWIHWRRSAGRREPVIREMARPVPEEIFIVLDIAAPGDEEAMEVREYLLRFVATLITHSLGRGFQVGMVLSSGGEVVTIAPGTTRGTRCELLDSLSRVNGETASAGELLSRVQRRYLKNAQVLAVSPDPERLDSGAMRAVAGECRHLTILGPAEIGRIFEDAPMAAREADDAD